MLKWLGRIFGWWNGATLNTLLSTRRFGERVGADEFGNVYYRTIGGKIDPALGFERRWVIFNGYAEGFGDAARLVWMASSHRRRASDGGGLRPAAWQKAHVPNMTGTPEAWRPPGSALRANARPSTTGDYDAWTPEG